MGHWSPETDSSPVRSFSWILRKEFQWPRRDNPNGPTYTLSDQSTPAGQRRAPVTWWLKPRSTFTFRAIGGIRGSLGGDSQSIIADFRLFVSSDLALDAPFCGNWQEIARLRECKGCLDYLAYHCWYEMNIVFCPCHQTFLQSRCGLKQCSEHSMFSSLPAKCSDETRSRKSEETNWRWDILCCKSFLRFIGKFSHFQKTILD